uniref:Uncharacterized protein n=1 Tax=Panagrolaimus sp. ES5 TaxID=591445 RepID=A0AC34FY82_9BILA
MYRFRRTFKSFADEINCYNAYVTGVNMPIISERIYVHKLTKNQIMMVITALNSASPAAVDEEVADTAEPISTSEPAGPVSGLVGDEEPDFAEKQFVDASGEEIGNKDGESQVDKKEVEEEEEKQEEEAVVFSEEHGQQIIYFCREVFEEVISWEEFRDCFIDCGYDTYQAAPILIEKLENAEGRNFDLNVTVSSTSTRVNLTPKTNKAAEVTPVSAISPASAEIQRNLEREEKSLILALKKLQVAAVLNAGNQFNCINN